MWIFVYGSMNLKLSVVHLFTIWQIWQTSGSFIEAHQVPFVYKINNVSGVFLKWVFKKWLERSVQQMVPYLLRKAVTFDSL